MSNQKTAGKTPDIDAIKAEHGDVFEIESSGVSIIVKAPSRGAWKRFRTSAQNERQRVNAVGNLLRDCLVWPDHNAFEQILEKQPALEDVFAGEVVEIAGAAEATTRKKL